MATLQQSAYAMPYYRVDGSTGAVLPASPQGSATLTTGQVSVGTTATLIRAAGTTRNSITVTNITGAQQVFIGNAGVTLATGQLLPAAVGASVTIPFQGAVYGIAATAAQTVSFMETSA